MSIEYIRYRVEQELHDTFIEAYTKASRQLDRSEHCKAYELTECEEEDGQFILRIEWTSTEAHLNGFRKSSLFPEFFDNVKSFFNNIQEMRHYRLTAVVKNK